MGVNPEYVYCTLCGMYLQGDAIVYSGPHWPKLEDASSIIVSDKDVTRYEAQAQSYYGQIELPDGKVLSPPEACDIDPQNGHLSNGSPTAMLYIGLHPACEDIATRFMMDQPNATIHSTGDLWVTLERRCSSYLRQALKQRLLGRDNNFLPPISDKETREPSFSGYYVPFDCLVQWGDDWTGWWDEDAIEIPDLTTEIISNLERQQHSSNAKIKELIELSPAEIKNHICSFVQDGGFSPNPTYLMPQYLWAKIFFQIPFLWDLDMGAIYAQTGSNEDDLEKWNWEKLTRQVMTRVQWPAYGASSDDNEIVWDYSKAGLQVPAGLTNRRRIWQILQDM